MRLSKRRTGIALLVIVGIAASLSACSTNDTVAEGNKVLTVSIDVAERIDGIVKNFEAAHPGVTVDVVANSDSYDTYMQTLIAAGTAPDVIRTFPGAGNVMGIALLAKAGVIEDVGDAKWAGDLTTGQLNLFGYEGDAYAVPLGATGIGVLWNDQAMASIGATPPTTFNELLDLCATAKANGKVAFTLFQKGGNVVQSYAQVASLVYGKDPSFTQEQYDGKATFAGSGWETALEQQLQLNAAGCFNEGVNGTDWPASAAMVGAGDALGIIAFSEISGLTATAPADTTWTMAAMPTGNDAADNYMAVADSTGFSINSKAKEPELAREFLAYLATAEAQNLFANALGGAPAIPNDKFEPQNEQQKVVAQFKADGKVGPWPDQEWPGSDVQTTLNDVVQKLFAGAITPAEGAALMDDAFAKAQK